MNDHNKSQNDPSDEPSRIEQQLKQFRPRAPQLDIAAITLASAQPLQPSAPPTIRQAERTGVTAAQFATAIAASWLVGALVGGGCIFYALNPNSTNVATNNQSDRIDPTSVTEQNVAVQTHDTNPPANVQPNQLASAASSSGDRQFADSRPQSLFDLDFNALPLDAQLTARGLTPSTSRALTVDRYVTTTSKRSTNEPFTPTPPSNRSQLMKDFLSDPNFQIQ